MKRLMVLAWMAGTLLVLVAGQELKAQTHGGATGYQLLMTPDARSWGMGRVGVTSVVNAASTMWNPAAMAFIDKKQFFLSHSNLWSAADYNFIGYAVPTLVGTYVINYAQVSTGDIDQMDADGNKTGSFSDNYRVLIAGYGGSLFDLFAFGFTAKGINHSFADWMTYGYSFSGGLLFNVYKGIRIGASTLDAYGNEFRNKKKLFNYDATRKIGLSYNMAHDQVSVAMDYLLLPDNRREMAYGIEFNLVRQLSLRLGRYATHNTFGFGLSLGDFKLDFATAEHELGSQNFLSISHNFGQSISIKRTELQKKRQTADELIASGIKSYNDQKFDEALAQFNKAVILLPDLQKAQNWQRKTDEIVRKFKQVKDQLQLNKYEMAVFFLDELLALEENNKEAVELKAEVEKKAEIRRKAESFYASGINYEKAERVKDAIEQWQRTLEIDPQHVGAISKLEQYDQLEPLKCEVQEIHDVFAAQYHSYANEPFGLVTLSNRDQTEITDVTIQIMIQKYLDYATTMTRLSSISGATEIKVPIKAVFNKTMVDLTTDSRVSAEITISYTFRRRPVRTNLTTSFAILNRNAIQWDRTEQIAAFITPKDLVLLRFQNEVLKMVEYDQFTAYPKNIVQAIALFNALEALNISYRPDPNNPYSQMADKRTQIDLVYFPRETIQKGSGDCDDLTVLYCSLLESVGIHTRVIDIPGHLFMAFDTGVKAEDAALLSASQNDYLIFDELVWLPIETTQINNHFFTAWQTAVKQLNRSRD